MAMPALPDDLKELVMFDWYTALWQRMHKRCAQDDGARLDCLSVVCAYRAGYLTLSHSPQAALKRIIEAKGAKVAGP